MMSNHHYYLIVDHFQHPLKKTHHHSAVTTNSPRSPTLVTSNIFHVSTNFLFILDVLYSWNLTIYGLLQLVSYSIMFSGLMHVSVLGPYLWSNNITFIVILHIVIRSRVGGNLVCFHFLCVNNFDMNIYVPVFVWKYIYNSLRPSSGIAGSHHNSYV